MFAMVISEGEGRSRGQISGDGLIGGFSVLPTSAAAASVAGPTSAAQTLSPAGRCALEVCAFVSDRESAN